MLFVFVTWYLCCIARDISRKESLLLAQIRYNFHAPQNVSTAQKREAKNASVKMIVLIILLFVLCHIGGNYRCFCFVFKLCVASESLKKVIHIIFITNSAVNPLVYAVLKKDMKNELKKMVLDRSCHCWHFFFPFNTILVTWIRFDWEAHQKLFLWNQSSNEHVKRDNCQNWQTTKNIMWFLVI